MKFTQKTVDVLKNFSTINPGLYFKKGNTISTMSPQKNILCEAVVEDTFPQDFGIHDLNNFLSVLALNKDPDVEFEEKNAVIKYLGGRSKIKYRFADQAMIITPPDKKITLPSVDVEFNWTEEDLAWIQKTAAILRSPHVAVISDGQTVSILAFDGTDDSAPTNSLELDIKSEKKYKLIFKTENLKMIPGAYVVKISSKGIAHFTNEKDNVQYWIATESASTYEA